MANPARRARRVRPDKTAHSARREREDERGGGQSGRGVGADARRVAQGQRGVAQARGRHRPAAQGQHHREGGAGENGGKARREHVGHRARLGGAPMRRDDENAQRDPRRDAAPGQQRRIGRRAREGEREAADRRRQREAGVKRRRGRGARPGNRAACAPASARRARRSRRRPPTARPPSPAGRARRRAPARRSPPRRGRTRRRRNSPWRRWRTRRRRSREQEVAHRRDLVLGREPRRVADARELDEPRLGATPGHRLGDLAGRTNPRRRRAAPASGRLCGPRPETGRRPAAASP